MPRTVNRERDWIGTIDEIKPQGRGYVLVQGLHDTTSDYNDGLVDRVPKGLEVRYLGEGAVSPGFEYPLGEFLIYDPTTVDIVVERIEGRDETPAVEKAQNFKAQGFVSGEIRPYHRHYIVWGQRPALIRAETATST